MHKRILLTSGVLSIALLVPSFAHAQSAVPSQAYGTPTQTYATSSSTSSSTSGTYQGTAGFFAPMSQRILSDPLYLPLAGQIEGISSYSLTLPSSSTYSLAGVKRSNNNGLDNSISQEVQYGATDDFSINVADTYAWGHGYNDNQINGNDTSNSSSGFTNPTFGAAYRFIDQRHNHPLDATAVFTYSPDMIDNSQAAGGGHSGNEASGRQVANFTVDVGREMRNLSIDAFTGATYEGRHTYESLATTDNIEGDPFWSYFLGLRTQWRVTERFSVNANYRWTAQGNSDSSNSTTGANTSLSNPDFSDFGIALNYHFIPNRLVGQIAYDYYDYSNSSNISTITPNTGSLTEDQNSNVIAARLFYVFN